MVRIKLHRHLEAVTISLFGFIGIFSKFAYILFLGDRGRGEEFKIFGYDYLSHFLWAFGNEVFVFSIGTLLWVSTNFFDAKKKIRNIFRIISGLSLGTSLYFMGWIFFQSYYSKTTEVLMAILFSIVGTLVFIPFLMYITKEIKNVRQLKSLVVDFFIEIRNVHFRSLLKNSHKLEFLDEVEIQKEARNELIKDLREDRKEITDNFEKRLHDKVDEIDS